MGISVIIGKNYNLSLLSQYRTQLMGMAALMIILCHAPQYGVEMPSLIHKLFVYLNIGVDIFLFLSGMGCGFSLMKSPNYFTWIKKRFIRIFVPYTFVLVFFRLLGLLFVDVSWERWLLNYSTIRFWTHHDGPWFIALLVLLYPLTPLIYWIFVRFKRRNLIAFTLIVLLLLITHIHICTHIDVINSVIRNLQWAFTRVVSFIIGLYLAPYIKQNLKVNTIYVIGASALGCILFHFFMKDVFYLWLYVLPTLIILSSLLKRISKVSKLNCFFLWLGAASLESYLTNVELKGLMPAIIYKWANNPIFFGHYLDYTLVIVFGLCSTFITHFISKRITATMQ